MRIAQGRWSIEFRDSRNESKTFHEMIRTCKSLNSDMAKVGEKRDVVQQQFYAQGDGGSNGDIYLGLDPSTLLQPCSDSPCEGLKWFDGSPYETALTNWNVNTNGKSKVQCFVLKFFKETRRFGVLGVNDCNTKRTSTCISKCSLQRCPIPPTVERTTNNWNYFTHSYGDRIA